MAVAQGYGKTSSNGLIFAYPQTEVTIGFSQNPLQTCN